MLTDILLRAAAATLKPRSRGAQRGGQFRGGPAGTAARVRDFRRSPASSFTAVESASVAAS